MNSKQQTSVPVVIPSVLDVEESELAARNEFLAEKDLFKTDDFDDVSNADEFKDEIIFDETDAAPGEVVEEREAKITRRAKRRKSMFFLLVFGAVFGIFVVFISWAFGFGFFAAQRLFNFRHQIKPPVQFHHLFQSRLSKSDAVVFEQISPQAKPAGGRILFLQVQDRVDCSEINFVVRDARSV